MIITKTPFRVSFFGGGTDYPKWFHENGGAVLSTTIDKYCYISCRPLPPFFEHTHRIVYSLIENVKEINEITHPAVRAVFDWMKVTTGIEVHHDGDLPARSGLGSSSSFTVGLINAMRALEGKQSSKEELARAAIHVEQDLIGESVGSQDQIAVAYGGLNRITFQRDGKFLVEPLVLAQERRQHLNDHMLLFFTGLTRFASGVAQKQLDNMDNRKAELSAMHEMVDEAITILQQPREDLPEFGRLLHQSWYLKRTLSDAVSTTGIDALYARALKAGAVGGKLLGAGGGGFLLIFAEPDAHASVQAALPELIHVPFRFESHGSHVALYQPQGL